MTEQVTTEKDEEIIACLLSKREYAIWGMDLAVLRRNSPTPDSGAIVRT